MGSFCLIFNIFLNTQHSRSGGEEIKINKELKELIWNTFTYDWKIEGKTKIKQLFCKSSKAKDKYTWESVSLWTKIL